MVDISLAFKELVDDFVSSAETEEQFQLFPLMCVAVWNISNHNEKQRTELIQVFIERFNCPTFIWNGTVMQTRNKILELCGKKRGCTLNSSNGSSALTLKAWKMA